jgi:hypothetical protein
MKLSKYFFDGQAISAQNRHKNRVQNNERVVPMELFETSWEQDREEGQFYVWLKNGDCIGYDEDREEFSLNNYWNVIDTNVVQSLLKRIGSDAS